MFFFIIKKCKGDFHLQIDCKKSVYTKFMIKCILIFLQSICVTSEISDSVHNLLSETPLSPIAPPNPHKPIT